MSSGASLPPLLMESPFLKIRLGACASAMQGTSRYCHAVVKASERPENQIAVLCPPTSLRKRKGQAVYSGVFRELNHLLLASK